MCSINGRVYQSPSEAAESKNNSLEDQRACDEFFRLLAVCHSVVIDTDKSTGKESMQASSPDELALVKGAKEAGYHFREKTSEKIGIHVDQTGRDE